MVKLKWYKAKPTNFDGVPEKAGIYIISTFYEEEIEDFEYSEEALAFYVPPTPEDGEYEVQYVGQSTNLQERANKHWSASEENEALKDHINEGNTMKFSYAEVSKKENRDGMELYLYIHFKPPFNKKRPPGKNCIKCNFPDKLIKAQERKSDDEE